MAAPPKSWYPLVQVLRAGAALAVAFVHTAHDAIARIGPSPLLERLDATVPWAAGIDVFFVISGFVIVTSSRPLFAAPDGRARFLVRRLARVVPLYWAATALTLLAAWAVPNAVHGGIGGPGYVLASFAFLPWARPDGLVQPPLGLAWTLNVEMFFYGVFAFCLRWREGRAVATACGLLLGLVLAGGLVRQPGAILSTWADPIVLEFCMGALLALLPGRLTASRLTRTFLMLAALAALCILDGWPNRVLACGLPALALVAAAVLGPPRTTLSPAGRATMVLGDASYALYLAHPFVMRALALLWTRAHLPAAPLAYTLTGLALAELAALAIHRTFEVPSTRAVRRRMEPLLIRAPIG